MTNTFSHEMQTGAIIVPGGGELRIPSGSGVALATMAQDTPPPPVGARPGDEVDINGVRYRCVQFLFLMPVQ